MPSINEALPFSAAYYAKGNGSLVLVTGRRLIHGVGTARSLFFAADSDLFGKFICFREDSKALTLCCYAEEERKDGATRSSVTFAVTAEEEALRISVTALHDMKICCHLSRGVRCEALGERRYRLLSLRGEVLYLSGEGRSFFDAEVGELCLYPGKSSFLLSFPSSGDVLPKKEKTQGDYLLSALSGREGGLLALGHRVSLSEYCRILSHATCRRDSHTAFSCVRFLEALYRKYHALPSSFLGDGSEGDLSQSIAMTEEIILTYSHFVKAFGVIPSDTLVAIAAEALTQPLSCRALKEGLFLVDNKISKAARLRAVRRADSFERRKDLLSC